MEKEIEEHCKLLGSLIRRWILEGNDVILKDKDGDTRYLTLHNYEEALDGTKSS